MLKGFASYNSWYNTRSDSNSISDAGLGDVVFSLKCLVDETKYWSESSRLAFFSGLFNAHRSVLFIGDEVTSNSFILKLFLVKTCKLTSIIFVLERRRDIIIN